MYWYRIKTVLIFLFLAINIFLAVLLGLGVHSKTELARKKGEAAAAALERNGIRVLASVPYKTPRLGTLTVENPLANPEALARQILGDGAVRLGNAWEKDGRKLTVLPESFLYESGTPSVKPENGAVSRMKTVLSDMGFPMEHARGELSDNAVLFRRELLKHPLFEACLFVYPAADGTVARMHGIWPAVSENPGTRAAIKPAAEALLTYLREGHTKAVTAITAGYAVMRAEEGYRTAEAVPVWRVHTEDDAVYDYDARQ